MHVTDIALECARECLRAAADIADRRQSHRLASIGQRLIDALIEDATICTLSSAGTAPDGSDGGRGMLLEPEAHLEPTSV